MDRRFFIKSGLTSLALGASNSVLGQGLGLLSNIASDTGGFKTLVCVNLKGGADSISLILPTLESEYRNYTQIRQNLGFQEFERVKLNPKNQNLGDFGMPSFMAEFDEMFNDGNLSIVSNVGPLVEPVKLSDIKANTQKVPLFIGSHNDQESMWQRGIANITEQSGWGGRLFEAINTSNSTISGNMSLSGTRLFSRGQLTNGYPIQPRFLRNLSNFVRWDTGEETFLKNTFDKLTASSKSHLLNDVYNQTTHSAIEKNQILQIALSDIPESSVVYPTESSSSMVRSSLEGLTSQFKRAAQLIEAAPVLNQTRQVIFIQFNLFDTHDSQKENLPELMSVLGKSLKAFHQDLISRNLDQRVVTFTQSEFGRTISINSNGTDHGWGGHQFVMGTPVNGGQFIGTLPEYQIGSNDVYKNMIIPQYSVEQYAGNIAKWFGLSASQITDVFPTYERFDDVDFGLFS